MLPNSQYGAALLSAFLFATSPSCKQASSVSPPEKPPLVEVSTVATATIPILREYSGTVKAVKSVDIIPNVTGYLQKREFTEGSLVQKGDPLYLIDPRPFEAVLAEAEARLKQDQANLDYWTKEAKRFTDLATGGSVSKADTDKAEAQLKEAQADVLIDQAAIEAAKLNLAYTRVMAPFTGRVQTTLKNVGALVTAEKDVLTTLVQIDPVYVEFNLTRREMFDLQALKGKGILSAADVQVVLTLPNGEQHPNPGKIDFVGSEVNSMTNSLLVRAVVKNSGGDGPEVNLVSGQYARISLDLGEQAGALVVPREALLETQAGPHVFVVSEDGTAEQRAVVPGSLYQKLQVISSGLKEGERVVISGIQSLRPGSKVQIKKPDPSTATDPGS